MKFINNPFDIMKEIIKESYPQVDCDIYFGQQLTDGEEKFGCTTFPDNEDEKPVIELYYKLSVEDAVEILAHELAHVIAGLEAEHNEEWKKVFDDIHYRFQDKIEEIFSK